MVEQETLNLDETTELEPESVNADDEADMTALKEKLLKAEELAKNQKIRAEKAEAEAKKLKVVQPKETETPKNEKSDYTLQDIRALSDVHDEDVEEVVRIAKLYNITISEAKKLPLTQTLLKQKTEERTTAQATNTGGGRRGTSKVTGEDLLEKFNQGQVPEKDEDIDKMIEARFTPKQK